jgi:hypothetical protein
MAPIWKLSVTTPIADSRDLRCGLALGPVGRRETPPRGGRREDRRVAPVPVDAHCLALAAARVFDLEARLVEHRLRGREELRRYFLVGTRPKGLPHRDDVGDLPATDRERTRSVHRALRRGQRRRCDSRVTRRFDSGLTRGQWIAMSTREFDPDPEKATPPSPGVNGSGGVEITAEVSPTRFFRITSEGSLEPWWLRFVNVEADGQHRVDSSPGLHLPFFEITAFRDLLIREMTRHGITPPRLTLEEVAQSYRADAEAGDQRALIVVQVLRALNLALDQDPSVAETWLRQAHRYLIDMRPDVVPLGAGDPRLRGSGRKPAAAEALLQVAREWEQDPTPPIPPFAYDPTVSDSFDYYALELDWVMEVVFLGAYTPREVEALVRCRDALAALLRTSDPRNAEAIVLATLRLYGVEEKKVHNFLSFLDKR